MFLAFVESLIRNERAQWFGSFSHVQVSSCVQVVKSAVVVMMALGAFLSSKNDHIDMTPEDGRDSPPEPKSRPDAPALDDPGASEGADPTAPGAVPSPEGAR